jgi:undecaprenyl-diphosphatase
MSLFHLVLLALVQGVTEFLPVSSSGHLVLLPLALGEQDQGLALDVAVHLGTLVAVMLYFRAEVGQALCGTLHLLTGRFSTPQARLALLLALASVPVVIAGAFLKLTGAVDALRSVAVIGWAMLGFGVLLWLADRRPGAQDEQGLAAWGWRDALVLGLWQVLALIPGTSRSGITMTGARFLGYSRPEAARISMLMSIPVIIASGVLLTGEALAEANWALIRQGGLAALMAFAAAYVSIAAMMAMLRRISFAPFVVYRVALGLVLLWVAYA